MSKRSYAQTEYRDLRTHPMPSRVEVSAISAVARGDATGVQQKLFFRYVVEMSGVHQVSSPDWSATQMAYAEGLRSLGILISGLARQPVLEIEEDHERDPDT